MQGNVFGACNSDCHRTANSRFDPSPTRAFRPCATANLNLSQKSGSAPDAADLQDRRTRMWTSKETLSSMLRPSGAARGTFQ
ncbi:Hypothetical predicted protein [Olea europaea subsp. europaea]|uniref:Uncharacterized protein n=1 Tax=Olea europaea subsp. europaea TaxID=158383 RepID=A0A8S0SPU1_OLEEU|nr:Hypothetical predicted protein [Olea europaea subsp. europaea]